MKCQWCQDVERHELEVARWRAAGLKDDHPLIATRISKAKGARVFAERDHNRFGECDNE